MKSQAPVFSTLSESACRALLRRNHVGRIAFTFKDRVDIEPISYVFDGDWLYARTSRGTKLEKLRHNRWVAFEADEVAGPFDWKSVVVRGAVYFLGGSAAADPDLVRAIRVLRRLDPRILTDEDLAP